MTAGRLPYVAGVVSPAQVAETAASIAAMQEPCGAVPWTPGEHVDIWNHVEAAMAMLVGGQVEAAERALDWVPTMQRPDGSWPMKIVDGEVDDPRGEVNMSAYLAVGLWHHWLVRHDIGYVRGVCPGDQADRFVINERGETVTLKRGASDAALAPYHVDRSKIFVRDRFKDVPGVDGERIARAKARNNSPARKG